MRIALIVAAVLVSTYAAARLAGALHHGHAVGRLRDQLRREAPSRPLRFSPASLDDVPPIVRRYLERAIPDGATVPRLARLTQQGGFRVKGDTFMNMQAEQLFSVQAPGLVWQARMDMAPGLPILVLDSLVAGRGEFGGRALGLITVAAGTGPDIDEATLVRYLSEAIWFPQALLPSPWLHWEAIDEHSARAVLIDRGRRVSGVFTFAPDGRPLAFDTERPRDVQGHTVRSRWHVVLDGHTRMAGVEIPATGRVSWLLPEGEYEYGRFQITELHFED